MTSPAGSESAGLLRDLYGMGLTQREIARRTGVTERMQRHVTMGSTPGVSYAATRRELRDRGTVQAPAPVRKQRVRTREGVSEEPRTKSTMTAKPRAGSYGHSAAVTAGGAGRVESWTFPHTAGPQRGQAAVEIVQTLKRMQGRQVSLIVKLRDPDSRKIYEQHRRGQSASSLIAAAKAHAKGMGLDRRSNASLAVGILAVIANMFPNGSAGHLGANIVGLTIEG